MSAHVIAPFTSGGLGRMLIQGVARDLTKRGIKAIEAFGDASSGDDEAETILGASGRCLAPADFFLSVGFKTVRAHREVPAAPAGVAHRAVVEVGRRVRVGEVARLDEPGFDPAPGAPGHPIDDRYPALLAEGTTAVLGNDGNAYRPVGAATSAVRPADTARSGR